MSTIPAAPAPTPRPQPAPAGPAGARPGGPAGIRPTGAAGTHPRMRRGASTATVIAHRKRLATAFVELFLEVEAGCRPPRHLAPLLCPMLYARLARVWHRGGRPGRVVSVSIIGTGPTAFDAVAVVRRGARAGAVSLRIVHRGDRWRVAELARPEDGELPGPGHPVVLDEGVGDDDAAIPVVMLRPAGAAGGGAGDRPAPAPSQGQIGPGWLIPATSG